MQHICCTLAHYLTLVPVHDTILVPVAMEIPGYTAPVKKIIHLNKKIFLENDRGEIPFHKISVYLEQRRELILARNFLHHKELALFVKTSILSRICRDFFEPLEPLELCLEPGKPHSERGTKTKLGTLIAKKNAKLWRKTMQNNSIVCLTE